MGNTNIDGLPSATTVDSADIFEIMQGGVNKQATIAQVLAAPIVPSWRAIGSGQLTSGVYTVVAADVGNGLEVSVTATIRMAAGLPDGTVLIRKAGTSDVTIDGPAVTLDLPGGRNKLTTQYQTMAAMKMASNHWTVSGAEA